MEERGERYLTFKVLLTLFPFLSPLIISVIQSQIAPDTVLKVHTLLGIPLLIAS